MTASSNVNENDGNVATTTNSITATNAAAVITGSTTPSSSRDDSVRLWLAAEADLVKFLPKWSELTHHNVECGRYGCNCTDGSIRLWLAAEAGRVKSIPKWSELTHHNVECGRCGCNCTDGECGGIPIKNDFRWEKKNQEVCLMSSPLLSSSSLLPSSYRFRSDLILPTYSYFFLLRSFRILAGRMIRLMSREIQDMKRQEILCYKFDVFVNHVLSF